MIRGVGGFLLNDVELGGDGSIGRGRSGRRYGDWPLLARDVEERRKSNNNKRLFVDQHSF